MQTDLIAYYGARAAEYERLYEKWGRQKDLVRLTAILQDVFRDKNVLEIACGTGWWTQRLALTAASVLASDINVSMLDIARDKYFARGNVEFQQDDFYRSAITQTFDGLLGGFIWSHIPLDQLDDFLEQVRRWVPPGGTAIFIDNLFVPGSSTPISHRDAGGNTYQTRYLEDGTEHLVLKNFPERDFLMEKLSRLGTEPEYLTLEHYWLAAVRLRCSIPFLSSPPPFPSPATPRRSPAH